MRKAFLRSLTIHASLLGQSLRADPMAPRTLGRLTRLGLGLPPYLTLQAAHWAALAADELLFPQLRSTPVRAPLFILGIPRSGTTLAHRALAASPRYTTLRTWEALFAPSVVQRRLVSAAGRVDSRLGAPAARLLRLATRIAAGDLDAVHPIGLDDAEEDYLALLPAAGCFIAALAFPGSRALWSLGRLDQTVADAQTDILLDAYDGMLRRHLIAHGGQATLLSKNAAFASWAGALARRYPDARFLICVRDPVDALSSQLSAIAAARDVFGTDPGGHGFDARFADMFANGYAHLRDQVRQHPQRMAVIDFDALRRSPAATLTTALHRVGLAPDTATQHALADADAEARHYRSRHAHDSRQLTPNIRARADAMRPDYTALLTHARPAHSRENALAEVS